MRRWQSNYRITPLMAKIIREKRKHGVKYRVLAAEYGVSISTIWRVCSYLSHRKTSMNEHIVRIYRNRIDDEKGQKHGT